MTQKSKTVMILLVAVLFYVIYLLILFIPNMIMIVYALRGILMSFGCCTAARLLITKIEKLK